MHSTDNPAFSRDKYGEARTRGASPYVASRLPVPVDKIEKGALLASSEDSNVQQMCLLHLLPKTSLYYLMALKTLSVCSQGHRTPGLRLLCPELGHNACFQGVTVDVFLFPCLVTSQEGGQGGDFETRQLLRTG